MSTLKSFITEALHLATNVQVLKVIYSEMSDLRTQHLLRQVSMAHIITTVMPIYNQFCTCITVTYVKY